MSLPITLHFAHANGFPAGSYNKLFDAMQPDLKVLAIDRFGHDPAMPIDDNWTNPAREMCQFIRQRTSGPVIAVGHSFGAVVSYIACCEQPELFKGLVMLDPPLATGLEQPLFRLLKKTPLIDKVTPAGLTKNRKYQWRTDEDVISYFRGKALFKHMDPDCVADYVHHGMTHTGDNWTLRFNVDVETRIFRTLPHNLPQYYGKLQCPSILITAERTQVCKASRWKPFARGNAMQQQVFKGGGHMFPLEQPLAVAELLKQTVNHMLR